MAQHFLLSAESRTLSLKEITRVARITEPPSRIYNVGNNRPARLGDFIDILERVLGQKANRRFERMQNGDVERTFADVTALERDLGVKPTTSLAVGLREFVDWYRSEWIPAMNAS